MTTLRRFHACDLFRFNNVNFDELTETVRVIASAAAPFSLPTHLTCWYWCVDVFAFAQYNMPYYMQYMAIWPAYFVVAEAPGDASRSQPPHMIGYLMGKAEGTGENWHGHVSAVTVCRAIPQPHSTAPSTTHLTTSSVSFLHHLLQVAAEYRRASMAQLFMGYCEQLSEVYRGYFVDLFVRVSNSVAVGMYRKFGYTPYRQVIGYYSGAEPEDAFDMRKALSRDPHKRSMVPLPKPVHPSEMDL